MIDSEFYWALAELQSFVAGSSDFCLEISYGFWSDLGCSSEFQQVSTSSSSDELWGGLVSCGGFLVLR